MSDLEIYINNRDSEKFCRHYLYKINNILFIIYIKLSQKLHIFVTKL
jgi:hypothetical protein